MKFNMRIVWRIGICLLIYEFGQAVAFKLNKGAVLDSVENNLNRNNDGYIYKNMCNTTNEFLNYLNDSKIEFPEFGAYFNNQTKNCKISYNNNNSTIGVDNKKNEQSLCYRNKLNIDIATCCMGEFENSMLSYVNDFECFIATIGSGNATLEIFGDQEENAINNRILEIMNFISNNTLNNVNNETQNVLNDSKIIQAYKESLELLNLIRDPINKMVKMFLFEGNLFNTQLNFIKYIVSIFCGLCSESIKKMILNTGTVNIIQVSPILFEKAKKMIMSNYKQLFEILSIFSIIIMKSKSRIETILDLHSEWITNILYNQLEESSYDTSGLMVVNNNLVNNLFKKKSSSSKDITVGGLKNYNRMNEYVGIMSMNSMKQEINKIVKNNYKNSNLVDIILNCIKEIPIYSNYSENNDYLNIDNNKYEMYTTVSVSDPSGRVFLSNFIIIPLECIKTVTHGILKIIPNPRNDLIAYEKISRSELINTKEIARQVISLFRNETLSINDINNETKNVNVGNDRLFNNYIIKPTHPDNIKDYENINGFVSIYEETEIEGKEKNYTKNKINNSLDTSYKESFVVVSNPGVLDASDLSKTPPYSDNLEGYLYLMSSDCYKANANYMVILCQVFILLFCFIY
ncbi:hypothetical protein FG379_001329 [Cryptosporidium bovis]|uniref:uncharacterized protein n=1 Tax=Cryptosporidium bovis TaxID=310047 RepID=UPI00351A8F29|nr:hypothetical protein FG379_001329 [Cryptosporidium bovis]